MRAPRFARGGNLAQALCSGPKMKNCGRKPLVGRVAFFCGPSVEKVPSWGLKMSGAEPEVLLWGPEHLGDHDP